MLFSVFTGDSTFARHTLKVMALKLYPNPVLPELGRGLHILHRLSLRAFAVRTIDHYSLDTCYTSTTILCSPHPYKLATSLED